MNNYNNIVKTMVICFEHYGFSFTMADCYIQHLWPELWQVINETVTRNLIWGFSETISKYSRQFYLESRLRWKKKLRVAALIRGGKLCRHCSSKECKDNKDIEIECPICNGKGCEGCEGGCFTIDGCPNQFVRSLLAPIRLADLFAKGLPPIAGGTLEQSASFLDFARWLEYEDELVKHDGRQ